MQYVDEFSVLARYARDDVATDAAKQEKFMEGLNDDLSMQLMVATFTNYQELVDRALMIEGKAATDREPQKEVRTGEVQLWSSAEASFYPKLGRTYPS